MKQKLFFGLLFTLWVATYYTFTASAQTDIGVSNADATLRPALSSSTELNNAINSVPSRVASEFSDALKLTGLVAPDSAMKTILDQVAQRVGFEFADGSRVTNLQFPKELVNDTTPPQVAGEINAQIGNGSATLNWATNEFTIVIIHFGTQSGNYTGSKSITTFAKQHTLTLSSLTPGSTIFYKLDLTDLSGNTFSTTEKSLTVVQQRSVYLPLVTR